MDAPDLFGPLAVKLLVSGGVYGAIKANIASLMQRQNRTEKRLDDHIEDHAKGMFK